VTPADYRQAEWSTLLRALAADAAVEEPGSAAETEAVWLELRRRLTLAAAYVLRDAPELRVEVDDIVQTVLVKLQAPDILSRLLEKKSAGGYVVIMVRNAARDVIRSHQKERESLERFGHESSSRPASYLERRQHRERLALLKGAIDKLSEHDKWLLRGKFWENRSIRELAMLDGSSYSATAVRLFRLIRKLRVDIE
jgi:RNA polymerase sigma factor (sigma-70 family)